MSTLYEQLGGKSAVELAVDKFYDRVLADERISHFFTEVDMLKQRSHQVAFLTYAFGGTTRYEGRSMQAAHQRLVTDLGLTDQHFDAVVENLAATLQELGVSDPLIQQVGALAESIRGDVLNHR